MSILKFRLVRTCHIVPPIEIGGYAYLSFPQLLLGATLITHYSSLIPVGSANLAPARLTYGIPSIAIGGYNNHPPAKLPGSFIAGIAAVAPVRLLAGIYIWTNAFGAQGYSVKPVPTAWKAIR
jgi:hypothetical protein